MPEYQLNIIINGDASGLDAAVSGLDNLATATQTMGASATNAASQSGNFFSGLLGNLANIKAGIDMFAGLGGAVIGVGQSLIAGSAEFEGYEARFASLMGSTDAAKDKIQELSTFASTTPFELPDVIKASQSLQVFGGSALNTKENLAVVGNAAAATGQNIGDVSFWFARAYSAIQNGQPFGEAAQNLQQMGVMSGDTVVKLDALKNSGASNQQVWEAFAGSLNAPTDAMAKMGGTWTGLTSTLSDSWSLLVRTFGQPLFDELKPQMQGVIDQLSSSGLIDAVGQLGTAFASVLAPAISFVAGTVIPGVVAAIQFIAPAVSEAINILSQVGAIFGELAGQAMGWGQNIINQLAGGMMDAAAAVMSVLHSIGGMIANLLMPGSPPKLLPELDTWGAGAMSAYLEGWGQADFGVFNSISDSIKGALDGIAKASGDKGMNIASIMLGSQDDIAKAINEVHQFGKVSEETFNGLISAIGPAGSEVSGLVSAYLDLQAATQNVASAQQELNSVTDEYAAKLSPLNAQLKGIQNQKQAIQDQKKLADLQAKLADQSLSDADRQMAMLEQQEIMTRQQIRTTEAERDTAVGASKAKLDAAKQEQAAAQARVNQQKALVDAQNKTNALIAEQSKAMAGAAGAMKGAAAAAAPLMNVMENVQKPIAAVNNTLQKADDYYKDTTASIGTFAASIQQFLAPAINFITSNLDAFMGALTGVGAALGVFAVSEFLAPALWSAAATAIGVLSTALSVILSPIGLLIAASAVLGAALSTDFMGITTALGGILPIWGQFTGVIQQTIAAFQSGGLGAAFDTLLSGLLGVGNALLEWGGQLGSVLLSIGGVIWDSVVVWGTALVNWIAPYAELAIIQLGQWAVGVYTWIVTQAPIIVAQLLTWSSAFLSWITPLAETALVYLGQWVLGIYTWITTQAPLLLAQFLTWGQSLVDWISPYAALALTTLSTWLTGLWTWVQQQAPGWLVTLGSWGMALVDWATPYLSLALTTLSTWVGGLWAWVQEQAPGWLAQLSAWGTTLAEWIGPAIPPALTALGELATSAFAWVGEQAAPLLTSFSAWASSIVEWIAPATVSFLAAWPGMLSSFLDWIASAAGPILAQLGTWALQFVGWIIPMIPSFIVALGGIAIALAAFIIETAAVLVAKLWQWKQAFVAWMAEVSPMLRPALAQFVQNIKDWIASAGAAIGDAAISIGNNIIDGIKKGVSAGVGALKDMVKNAAKSALDAAKSALGIASPSKVFEQQVGAMIPSGMGKGITAGMPVVNKNLVDGIAGLSESAVKAITAGSQAIAAASAYRGPGDAGLSGFLAAFADLATRFNDTAVALGGRVLGTATRFADTVGKVIAPIATAVAAFASLADLVVPARATVGQFGDALALVVGNINVVASWFQQKSVDVGAKFADGAGKMLSIVGPALEAFKKLPDLVVPSRTAVGQFGGALALVVGNIAHVATWFNAQAVTAGAAFAESAGKILALIGSGVDALSKLTTFVGIPQIAVTLFGQALQQSLVVLVAIATTWTQTTIDQAAKFSDGAGKVISIIGSSVEGFLKLRDFQGVPQTAIDAFGQALNAALGAIEYVSANWIAQFVERAATFAEGAGKAISIIGGAVDGFVKLATFQGVPQGAIDAFGQALNAVLTVIEYISAQWIQAFVDRAATFAEGAGKAVGIIGSAVDGFLKLVTFQGVPEAAFAAFGQALTRALTVIDAMSADWASIGLDRAVAWAGAVDAIVKTITAAVDAIGKLGQLQNGAAGLLDTFSVTLNGILTEMQRQILPATTISGENMVIGLINGILSQRSALVTAMVNTVMAAVIAARQTLGIASPSKVFEQIGQYAGAGLQGGMAAMQPAVAATSAGLGISAVNATTSALRPSGGGTTNNNQRNITVNVTVGKDAGSNPYATADAVVTEINRRLGMQGT